MVVDCCKKYLPVLGSMLFLISVLFSCANIASPTGGEYDYDPPKLLRTSPRLNATNVVKNKITFEFDENIKLENQNEKVIITPPQKRMPIIRSANKKVSVQLNDSLKPNVTYIVDFTDAIRDNNEDNVLENFAYAFSTGNYIDSLAISGIVLQADNLEPITGIYVGIHSNLNDTAFTKLPFDRISRTNDYGKFTVRGLAPGTYSIFALADGNRDYIYDNPAEAIAFLDIPITPSVIKDVRNDTISKTSGEFVVDSISTIRYNRYIPDDIVLRSFSSSFQRQYLSKHERVKNKLSLYFGAPTSMPKLTPLSFERDKLSDWAIIEKNKNNDSINFWIADTLINKMDTLRFELSYMMTDTLNQLVPQLDTLMFVDRTKPVAKKDTKKKRKKDAVEAVDFLKLETNLTTSLDVYKNVYFIFEEPLQTDLKKTIKFEELKDTTYHPLPLNLVVDSLNPRKYNLIHKWNYEKEYRLSMDSATIYSIQGKWTDKYIQKIKIKKEDEYGFIALRINGIDDSIPAFVELLTSNDVPVRKSIVKDNVVLFKNLNPGKYFARIILDKNANGVWDTGDYSLKLQPEWVCYYPKFFDIKANFHQEEDWTVDTSNILNSKPLEITKNKPKDKKTRKQQLEQKDQKEQRKQRRNDDQLRQQTQDPTQLNTSSMLRR